LEAGLNAGERGPGGEFLQESKPLSHDRWKNFVDSVKRSVLKHPERNFERKPYHGKKKG